MKIRNLLASLITAMGCTKPTPTMFTTGGDEVPAEQGRTYHWSFKEAAGGALSPDFLSVLGVWRMEAADPATATSNVLRQTGSFKNPDFPRVLVKGSTFTDLTVRVRCRPEKGDIDRACGVMFRVKDSDNYYIARANALEGNVRIYRVVNGDRQQFGSADLEVTAGQWHTLEASAQGTKLIVSWDGRSVIEAIDATFAKGKIGLWTKSDSITAFDDLEVLAR